LTRTGITLAVIVKDEADWLKDLLFHHAPLYEAAVVVDTGSADTSIQTARQAGAQVLSFPWRDDFAAARNHGLAAVRTPWVLVLDCDERIDPRDFPALRGLAAGPPQCHLLPQWNYLPTDDPLAWEPVPKDYASMAGTAAGFVPVWSIRLFPALPTLRYKGQVHESLVWEDLGDPDPIRTDIPVHHYGHLPEYSRGKVRNELYFSLLQEKVKTCPEDSRAWVELGAQLLERQRWALAGRVLETVVARFPEAADIHRGRLLLGRLRERAGDPAGAREQFDLALRARPDLRPCWVEATRAAIGQGDRERATSLVKQGRNLFPLDPGLKSLEAKVSKGLCR